MTARVPVNELGSSVHLLKTGLRAKEHRLDEPFRVSPITKIKSFLAAFPGSQLLFFCSDGPNKMKTKLNKLEMLRGFAALYVFASHFVITRIFPKQSEVGFFFRFGQEAVMLFFLLSGFVVFYSTAKNGDTAFRPYFIRRLRRIYPIFLLALVISGLVAVQASGSWPTLHVGQLLGNLFMLQDFKGGKPGVWVSPLFGNVALWSLAYEWWFYMLFFPIYHYLKPRFQIHVVACLSIVGFATYSFHPNEISLILMYFILWWCGAELARTYLGQTTLTFRKQKSSILYLALLTALVAVPVGYALYGHRPLSFGMHPIIEFRHFGACLIFLVGGLVWSKARWIGFARLFGGFAVIAPISYALYVFHYPLAVKSSFLDFIPYTPVRILGYLAITFFAAYLAEVPFQKWVNRITRGFTQRSKAPQLFPENSVHAQYQLSGGTTADGAVGRVAVPVEPIADAPSA